MLRIALVASLALAMSALSACNAVNGLGQDIESVGQAGDEAI